MTLSSNKKLISSEHTDKRSSEDSSLKRGFRSFLIGVFGAGFGLCVLPLVSLFFPNMNVKSGDSIYSGSDVESRVSELAAEISKVQDYEKELRDKSDAIEAVLLEIEGVGSQMFEENVQNAEDMARGGDETNNTESEKKDLSAENIDPKPSSEEAKKKTSATSSDFSVFERFLKRDSNASLLEDLNLKLELLSGLPLGLPTVGRLTSGFGYRNSPFSGRRTAHKGIDIAGERLAVVKATAPGVVTRAGRYGGYGNAVVIKHDNGFETLFGHLDKVTVKKNEEVCRGQQVGQLGSTGRSTGPHLHYEVRLEKVHRDPLRFAEFRRFINLLETENQKAS